VEAVHRHGDRRPGAVLLPQCLGQAHREGGLPGGGRAGDADQDPGLVGIKQRGERFTRPGDDGRMGADHVDTIAQASSHRYT
jgi:hypothetical protein